MVLVDWFFITFKSWMTDDPFYVHTWVRVHVMIQVLKTILNKVQSVHAVNTHATVCKFPNPPPCIRRLLFVVQVHNSSRLHYDYHLKCTLLLPLLPEQYFCYLGGVSNYILHSTYPILNINLLDMWNSGL